MTGLWFHSKVGATMIQPPYVIVLYKRQDAQNVVLEKKKKKNRIELKQLEIIKF